MTNTGPHADYCLLMLLWILQYYLYMVLLCVYQLLTSACLHKKLSNILSQKINVCAVLNKLWVRLIKMFAKYFSDKDGDKNCSPSYGSVWLYSPALPEAWLRCLPFYWTPGPCGECGPVRLEGVKAPAPAGTAPAFEPKVAPAGVARSSSS